jgi:hypothetical protein
MEMIAAVTPGAEETAMRDRGDRDRGYSHDTGRGE